MNRLKFGLSVVVWVSLAASPGIACAQPQQEKRDVSPNNTSHPADAKTPVSKHVKKQEKIIRSEKEWRKLLTREQYRVLRGKGTERPFRNKYDKHFEPGKYLCAACGQELFASDTKFNSGCGWPAFYASMAGDRVILRPDYSLGMVRTEVLCARCESHLGHIFRDAPQTPTGQRYCINSAALKFVPAKPTDSNDQSEEEPRQNKRSGKPDRVRTSRPKR